MKIFRWGYSQPYLLLFLTTLFWAGNAVAGKMAVGHISPFLLTTCRWMVALILILPFAYRHISNDWVEIRSRMVFMFVLGFIGFTAFNNLMYLALTSTTAINVVIIQSALPLFVFLLNLIFYKIAANGHQLLGFSLTLIGVIIITFRGSITLLAEFQFNPGDALMLVAIAAYGIYSVMLKNKPPIHWLSTMVVLSGAAFISSIPFALLEFAIGDLNPPDLTGILLVIYTAVFASFAAQAFWIRSIELIGSNTTSIFINLVPLLGAVLAILMLGENFYAFHATGIVLIIVGVTVAQSIGQSRKKIKP